MDDEVWTILNLECKIYKSNSIAKTGNLEIEGIK